MIGIQYMRLATWLAVVVLTSLCGSALAGPRVALVIGNAAYAHAPALANPVHDATDVAAALTRLGFTVTRIENTGYVALRRGLMEFQRAASVSEVAVVFYAGHGIEVDQRNFLVPVDARLANDQDVEFEAVPLDLVSQAVERASGLRLVILDACRENPFVVTMQRAGATRSIGRGLARVEPSGETLVAYAAREGTVAEDGAGRNSPYSEALLAYLEEPGLEVGLMFRKVRDAVLASTGGRQEPFTYGSLSSRGTYLGTPPASAMVSPMVAGSGKSESASERLTAEQLAAKRLADEKELEFWKSVKDSDDPADIQAYQDRYPGGSYEILARNRLKRLEGVSDGASGEGATPPPPVPAAFPGPAEMEKSLELKRSERRRIQMALASLGFDPGPADGLFGPRTRGVIGEWQRGKGYEKTGYLTKKQVETLVTLGEEAEHVAGERRREETQPKQRERLSVIPFSPNWDDARYRWAKKQNTKEAYRGYLTEYPNGRHADEARRRLKGLSVVVGRRFRDCPECPELVVVAAGTYEMGSPLGEEGRRDNEGPVHRVEIGEPFAVGVYEVTVGEFGQFVEETRHSAEGCGIWGDTWKKIPGWSWRRPGFDQSEHHPVACVNWEDAQAFARWLSRKTGKGYRLLSESEWEYVARGGTRTPWYWGGSEVDQCRHGNGADETLERGFGEAFTMSRESADALKKTLASWSLASCDDGHVHASPGGEQAHAFSGDLGLIGSD